MSSPCTALSRLQRRKLLTIIQKSQLQLISRSESTVALESPVSPEALDKAKPFRDIPGPKPLPFIGNVHRYLPGIGDYSKAYWHEAQRSKFHQYGSIVREEFVPGFSMVHLYDPRDIETVSRHEGKYPTRNFFVGMKTLREQKPELYTTVGVAAGNGPDWHYIRSRSQKVMMRPQVMKRYLPQMNVIAEDLVQRIRALRNEKHHVPELMGEFFKWALESVTYILFNQRMGCLEPNLAKDSMALKYIQAVNDFFRVSAKVELATIPIWMVFPSLSPSFHKLKRVHNFFFESAMEYVKEGMKKLKENDTEVDEEDLSLIEMLLKHCSPEDATIMAIDSMAAGIDTTSLTTAYVLRNLAANPDVQKKLQEEVDRVLPNKQPLTLKAMDQIPYLKACIKESMRISPTVQGTSRTLEQDIVLSGYRIPANTQMTLNYYVSSVQESNFPDALSYKPERWLKGSGTRTETFAFQPFGFGPRMCIGRRIADLEMLTLLTKIMQNFWIENKHHDLDIHFQLVLMIKSPLLYEFHERRC